MRKGQNRNINMVGRVSCLGLLALGLMLVNPVSSSVYAEGGSAGVGSSDEGISAQADTPSTVGISFAPSSGAASLTPTTAAGQSAQVNVLATVSVANSGGYSVYLGSNNVNLVGKNNTANVIPGISGNVTYDNLATDTWGYSANVGTTIPANATYKAVSVGQGDKVAENTNKKIVSDTKQIMLSFVAKIGTNKPADTYQNTVTMSVVSSPLQTTLTDISEMQSMTTAICEASDMYETKQLKDVRDGKYYWVTKLADNKCWMTQNLALDLSTSTALTSATSDVSSNWTPGFTTATVADSSNMSTVTTEQRSWNLGDYRLINPAASSSCGYGNNTAADCPEQLTAYATPVTANNDENAHYILGNFYQWNAATAGTGGTITSGEASGSICPKGWKLPTSNSTASGSFGGLIAAGNIGTDVVKLTSAPYYFVRGGVVWTLSTNRFFVDAGSTGRYWSSTPASESSGDYAYLIYFIGDKNIYPNDSGVASSVRTKPLGLSVRCLAR